MQECEVNSTLGPALPEQVALKARRAGFAIAFCPQGFGLQGSMDVGSGGGGRTHSMNALPRAASKNPPKDSQWRKGISL